MGFMDDINEGFGEVTGFGSNGNPDPHNLDDAAYEDYYQKALAGVQGSGSGTADLRAGVQSGLNDQLAGLQNNAAGRKKNFEEDTSRAFGDNLQNKARATGGTGNLAQALSPTGAQADANARQTSRGYNDLYSQATKDLNSIGQTQNAFEQQDAARANEAASLSMNRINQRQGVANQDAANSRNSDQVGTERRIGTVKGISNMIGSQSGGSSAGGGGFAKGGKVPKFDDGGMMGMLDPLGLTKMLGGGGGGGGGAASLAPLAMMAMKDGGEVEGYDDGGMMSSLMKLAPLALMALKKGGEVEGLEDDDDVVSTGNLGKRPVPGKAPVRGDSPRNDKVNAKLSPGEVVLPRSVTQGKNPVQKGTKFLDETLNQGKHHHKAPNYFVGGPEVDADAGPMPSGDGGGEEEAAPEGGGGGDSGGKGGGEQKKKSPMDYLNGIFDNASMAAASEQNAPAARTPTLSKFAKGGMEEHARKRLKAMQSMRGAC